LHPLQRQHSFILAPRLADTMSALIRRTREAVRELDTQQGERFRHKILLGIPEGNEGGVGAGDTSSNSVLQDDVSTGEESTVSGRSIFTQYFFSYSVYLCIG